MINILILKKKGCILIYRKGVILRRTQFELDKALARAHILEGLKIALDNIDEVINIIRSSYDDAKERLTKKGDAYRLIEGVDHIQYITNDQLKTIYLKW